MKRIILILVTLINSSILFSQYNWVQVGNNLSGENANEQAGRSVTINKKGDVVAIGIYNADGVSGSQSGQVKVFREINGNWQQIGTTISGESSGDLSGWSVNLDSTGNTLAIGAIRNDGGGDASGHVRVYNNVNDNWVQIGQDIDGEDTGEDCGYSVSLSSNGRILAVSSLANEFMGPESGQVRVFQLVNNTWTQVGQSLYGTTWHTNFGTTVDLSNDATVLAVGAAGQIEGYVYVYKNINGTWTQIGQSIIGSATDDLFGHNLSLSDNGIILAIGARQNDGNGNNAGQVSVFEYDGANWNQLGQVLEGNNPEDNFGKAVSLNSVGNILAVGANRNNDNGTDAGQVKIYEYSNTSWIQISQNINGTDSLDHSGSSVCLNGYGNRVIIGARYNSDGGLYSGNARVFETSFLSINDNDSDEFVIYPNPTSNFVFINQKQNNGIITITDLTGKEVKSKPIFQCNNKIDVTGLNSGIYFIHISTNKTVVKTIKLIIE